MEPSLPEMSEADLRADPRTSIYLAAALYTDGCSSPVKIRNLSATGALLEGAVIPRTGSLVQLVRGTLIAHGLVAWTTEKRCGLKFSGRVDVQSWRSAPTNVEQQRVDEVIKLVKAGAVPLPVPPLGQTRQSDRAAADGPDLVGDLRQISELLDKLGEELAADTDVVTRHGPALQNVDIAMQMIAAIEAIMEDQGNVEPNNAKLVGLRRSADQALQRGAC